MIEKYFGKIEKLLQTFPIITVYALTKKIYNHKQGYIRGSVNFENGCYLEFMELKDTNKDEKIKYRYQYMDAEKKLIFRYDNASHYQRLKNFPHHKHTKIDVLASPEPTLEDILFEIFQENR